MKIARRFNAGLFSFCLFGTEGSCQNSGRTVEKVRHLLPVSDVFKQAHFADEVGRSVPRPPSGMEDYW